MAKKFTRQHDPDAHKEAMRYERPIVSRTFILDYLQSVGKPVSIKTLLKTFTIQKKSEKIAFERRLKAMLRDGQLLLDRAQKYSIAQALELLKGTVVYVKDQGYAVQLDDARQIPLQSRYQHLVFAGDQVLVHIIPASAFRQCSTLLVQVIERAHSSVTGRYLERSGIRYIESSLKGFKCDVVVAKNLAKAKIGDYVVADIIAYPEGKQHFCTAHISRVLGDPTMPGIERLVAKSAHAIIDTWPDAIYPEIEALSYTIDAETIASRCDLRHVPLVTIDGDDSRDFDDAVYVERQADGQFILHVAIADVSHYVQAGSALDQSAYARATSVYFPREVVPMLPEALSNDLCSLLPEQDRLALVATMHVDATGQLRHYQFRQAIIHSHARLTYNKVYRMLQGELPVMDWFSQPLADLEALYQQLIMQRTQRGAIEFNTAETQLIFDKAGKITKIVPAHRHIAHKMIEECMLLANHAAARFLQEKQVPTLFRVHAPPAESKIAKLQPLLAQLGVHDRIDGEITAATYNRIMGQVQDSPHAHIVNVLLLRTMQQAAYQPENIGHFGLCYEDYVHFTSPIRRYPDLLVHRTIVHCLTQPDAGPLVSQKQLTEIGQHCSMAERRADFASRDVIAWLKCCYMQDKIGEIFTGTVSGVTNFGLFVELDGLMVEGLVHISSLDNDYYTYDPVYNRLRGRKEKRGYGLGDSVTIQVARVDLHAKFLDFEPLLEHAE